MATRTGLARTRARNAHVNARCITTVPLEGRALAGCDAFVVPVWPLPLQTIRQMRLNS